MAEIAGKKYAKNWTVLPGCPLLRSSNRIGPPDYCRGRPRKSDSTQHDGCRVPQILRDEKRKTPVRTPRQEAGTMRDPPELPQPTLRTILEFQHISDNKDLEIIKKDWPRLYTDGNKTEGKVGAAVSCLD